MPLEDYKCFSLSADVTTQTIITLWEAEVVTRLCPILRRAWASLESSPPPHSAATGGRTPAGLKERGRPGSTEAKHKFLQAGPAWTPGPEPKESAPAYQAAGDAWMGSAESHGPCSSSRQPQPLRHVPPRVPTDLRRCRARPCATPRVRRAQPRASRRSSARPEPPRALSPEPPRPRAPSRQPGASDSCPERRPHGAHCAGQRPARLRRKRSGRPGRRAGRAPRTAAAPGRAASCLTDSPISKSATRDEAQQPMAAGGRGGLGPRGIPAAVPPFVAGLALVAAPARGCSCGREETPGLGWRGHRAPWNRGQSRVESMGRREACGQDSPACEGRNKLREEGARQQSKGIAGGVSPVAALFRTSLLD